MVHHYRPFPHGGTDIPATCACGIFRCHYVLPARQRHAQPRQQRRPQPPPIAPGGIHWTAAGSGVVHEEEPDRPGELCEGFQIFVRQPVVQTALLSGMRA